MNANVHEHPRVDLVFEGQVLEGFDADQVKRAIGDFFKLDATRRERMFLGAPYVVKRGVTSEDASRYVALFAKLGGRLHSRVGTAVDAPKASAESAGDLVRPAVPKPPVAAMPVPVSAAAAPLALVPTEDPPAGATQARTEAAPPARDWARRRDDDSEMPSADPVVVLDEPPSVFGVGLSGRLSRRVYASAALFGWAAIRWSMLGLAHHPSRGMAALIGLGLLALALWTLRLTVLRLHDVGLPGWWALVGAVPVVGTIASLLLAAWPGSREDNRFGAVPDEGSLFLRYVVVVAVACIGAGFRHGLMWSDGGGGQAVAEQVMAQADTPPAAPSDEELGAVMKSAAARREFRENYWPAKNHKAFASSEGGAFGWSANAGSAEAAKTQALEQCDRGRDSYSSECRTLHVDGDWAE